MIEKWKSIEGYEGMYKISNLGRCISFKSCKEGKIIKPIKCLNGYLEYQLNKNGKRKCYMAHRLVALAFIPNPYNKEQVNHKDENISNNNFENLEWVTPKENANYGTRNERSIKNHNYNKVVQLTLNYEYVAKYENAKLASESVGLTNSSCIIRCCKKTNKQSKNYLWMYEKDYLDMITRREVI